MSFLSLFSGMSSLLGSFPTEELQRVCPDVRRHLNEFARNGRAIALYLPSCVWHSRQPNPFGFCSEYISCFRRFAIVGNTSFCIHSRSSFLNFPMLLKSSLGSLSFGMS